MAVVRAGGCLGMILHAKGRQIAMPHPFDRVVVEIAVRDFERRRQRFFVDREAMILRRDLDLAGLQIAAPADWRRDVRTSA